MLLHSRNINATDELLPHRDECSEILTLQRNDYDRNEMEEARRMAFA